MATCAFGLQDPESRNTERLTYHAIRAISDGEETSAWLLEYHRVLFKGFVYYAGLWEGRDICAVRFYRCTLDAETVFPLPFDFVVRTVIGDSDLRPVTIV